MFSAPLPINQAMSLIPTADDASFTAEARTSRLVLAPAEGSEHREFSQHDFDLEDRLDQVSGCLRGVLFAIVFQAAILSSCVLVFRIWRKMR
jgi:hypothetical protein